MTTVEPSDCLRSALDNVALTYVASESRLLLGGRDGLDLLHRISTNDLLRAPLTTLTATVLTNEKGRIIDALRVVQYGSGHLLLGSADAEEEVLWWIQKYTIADDVAVRSITAEMVLFAFIGRRSVETATRLTGTPLGGPEAWTCSVIGITCLVIPDVTSLLHRVYFLLPAGERERFSEWVRTQGICLLERDEWDTVRILGGIPSTPGEVSSRYTPYDIGMDWAVSGTKGCYIGQEVLARLDTYHKIRRTLTGIVGMEEGTPKEGDGLFASGEEVGTVTSMSPLRLNGRQFGLAVVQRQLATGEVLHTAGGVSVVTSTLPMALPGTEASSH